MSLQENYLKRLEKKYQVKVEIEKEAKQRLILSGLKDKVKTAEIEATNLLYGEFPKWRQKAAHCKIIADTVQWFYDDSE